MPLLFKGLRGTVLFHRPLQPSLVERGFFMPIQKFCDHFAHNFIYKRLKDYADGSTCYQSFRPPYSLYSIIVATNFINNSFGRGIWRPGN